MTQACLRGKASWEHTLDEFGPSSFLGTCVCENQRHRPSSLLQPELSQAADHSPWEGVVLFRCHQSEVPQARCPLLLLLNPVLRLCVSVSCQLSCREWSHQGGVLELAGCEASAYTGGKAGRPLSSVGHNGKDDPGHKQVPWCA